MFDLGNHYVLRSYDALENTSELFDMKENPTCF